MDRGDGVSINIDRWILGDEDEIRNDSNSIDGTQCSRCPHFIIHDNEIVWYHGGDPYCDDCYSELGLYPSEDYWENWHENKPNNITDSDTFIGENDER